MFDGKDLLLHKATVVANFYAYAPTFTGGVFAGVVFTGGRAVNGYYFMVTYTGNGQPLSAAPRPSVLFPDLTGDVGGAFLGV